MRRVSLVGTYLIGCWSVWLLLLAYGVMGEAAGEDPDYDAAMAHWSGTFKVFGILGLVASAFGAARLIIEGW